MKTARWTLGLAGAVLTSVALACEWGNPPTAPGPTGPAATADRLAAAVQDLASGTPQPIAGTFTLITEPIEVRQADGTTFIDYNYHEQLSGSFSGTRVGTGTLVIHADGTLNNKDTGFFTGAVSGISGSINIEAGEQGTSTSVNGSARTYPQTGTGGLAGLQAVVKVTGAATGPGTLAGSYEGQVHF